MRLWNLSKTSKIKRLGSEVFWITLGQIIYALSGIFSVKILTNFLSPEEYGNLALALTIVGLGSLTYIGPISQGGLRFYSVALNKQDFSNFFSAILKLFKNGTIIFGIIFVIAGIILSVLGYSRWVTISFLAVVLSSFNGINKIVGNIQNAARNRIIVAWHDSSMQWLKVVLAYVFIVIFVGSSEMALVGYIFATIVVLFSQIYFLKAKILNVFKTSFKIKNNIKSNYWTKNILSYSWPFLIWGFFAWGQAHGDKWLLGVIMSTYSVGLYTVLYKIGFQPAVILSNLSSRILAPIIFARVGDLSDEKKVTQTFNYHLIVILIIIGFSICGSGVSYMTSDIIFDLLVAEKYHSVSNYLWIMILAGGIYAAAEIASLNLMASFNTQKLLFPKILGSVIALVSYYLGASNFGILGLVVANLIYTLIYLVLILGMIYLNYGNLEKNFKKS